MRRGSLRQRRRGAWAFPHSESLSGGFAVHSFEGFQGPGIRRIVPVRPPPLLLPSPPPDENLPPPGVGASPLIEGHPFGRTIPAAWVRAHGRGRWGGPRPAVPATLNRFAEVGQALDACFRPLATTPWSFGDVADQLQARRICIRPATFALYRRRYGAAEVRSCAFTARGAQILHAASPLALPRRRRRGRDLRHSISAH